MKFLKTHKGFIVDGSGKKIFLRGINLGGWLMPEAYFVHAPNRGYHLFAKHFVKQCGQQALDDLEKSFRDHWIKENDIKAIAKMGANVLRVPFHYKLIEQKPYEYNLNGVAYLDKVIRWAKKYGMYVILDLHAVPGAQNTDWHSDSDGRALFWTNKSFQDRACKLWAFIANRYKNNPTVAGYDILNEAVTDKIAVVNRVYKKMVQSIRSVDQNHIVFIEGIHWAQRLQDLEYIDDSNLVLSIHHYEPIDVTFNFVPLLKYPLPEWNKTTTLKLLQKQKKIADKWGVPVFVGEFGVNARRGTCGEDKWLDDTLSCFKQLNFHWTYWTYKAVKSYIFPDGLFSYYTNDAWINRMGPLSGWNAWHLHWNDKKKQMIASWKTEKFTENKESSKIVKKYMGA